MTSERIRGRFEGMMQILRYNGRLYLLACAAVLVAASTALIASQNVWVSATLAAFAIGTILSVLASVAVAHYVYDLSGLYEWEWLRARVEVPERWTVIHAGLDEASPALRKLFPGATGGVLDIYDPMEMTEPAIVEARHSTKAPEARKARSGALPVEDASSDLVLLFFAAHELRRPEAREAFFRELKRLVTPKGSVVLVEHLRDVPNLLAFGPGVLHFLARREWLRLAALAGLVVREEHSLTPFVRIFFLGAAA